MRYAMIQNATVVNVIVADATFAAKVGAVACPEEVGIGWTFNGAQWAYPVAQATPAPSIVTMRQARLALLQIGKLADVDTLIAALPNPGKEQAQIEWEYATEVKRDSVLVAQLAPTLGLDASALDALFTTAALL